jgi:hypothetical protein
MQRYFRGVVVAIGELYRAESRDESSVGNRPWRAFPSRQVPCAMLL